MFERKTFKNSNILKLILFCITFFNPGLEATNNIYKDNGIIRNKNILKNYLANNSEEKIESVTASGFGTTLEKASQNAATNALTQVVGSFIDAETILKEQTNINNGIIEQTSIIKEDIKDYSQGSIKYFEVLNVEENGSLFKVIARVDVKIEDFRAYIKELASGSAKIKKNEVVNYFAKAAAELENTSNSISIIKDLYKPLYKGEVYEIEVDKTKFQLLSKWQTSSEYCTQNKIGNSNRKSCDPNGSYVKWDKNRTFIIPFSMSLKKDYQENLLNTLNNISSKKIIQNGIRQYASGFYDFRDFYKKHLNTDNDYHISVIDFEKNSKYIFIMKDLLNAYKRQVSDELGINFVDFYDRYIRKRYFYTPGADSVISRTCSSRAFNKLQISIKDENDITLKSKIIEPSCSYYSTYPISVWWKPSIPRYAASYNSSSSDSYNPWFSLLNSGQDYYSIVDRVIFTKKEFYLVMEINLDLLTKIDEIDISFLEN